MTHRILAAALLVGCSSPSATIGVTVGGEQDALDGVATIELDEVDRTGASQTLASGPVSQTNFDLGDQPQTVVVSLQLIGKNASGNPIVFGATPFVELGALSGSTIPLFVQKRGELARMPGTTLDARARPLLATTPRGIYFGGGSTPTDPSPPFSGYDLLLLDGFGGTCTLSSPPTSLALVNLAQATDAGDTAALVTIGTGELDEVLLPSCSVTAPLTTLPKGVESWDALAGDRTVIGDDGTAYFVGPSNPNVASAAILALAPSGNSTVLAAASARMGAATAFVPGHGVFLYGGGAPPEVVSAGGTSTTFCATPDSSTGLAAVAMDKATVLLAGDAAQPRTIDLKNSANCAVPWGVATNVALASPSLFALGDGAFLLVGDDSTGATRVFRLDATSTVEKNLRIPRQGARAAQTETGEIVIVGGGSATPESYFD